MENRDLLNRIHRVIYKSVHEKDNVYCLFLITYSLLSILIGYIVKMYINERNLGPQFFADTNGIIRMIKYNINVGGSFYLTARFFSPIYFQNVYVMRSVLFITTLFPILYYTFKYPANNVRVYLVTFPLMMILFNIYNNDISKEYIQFWFYFIILGILSLKDEPLKYMLITILFLAFALVFRIYMLLILLFFIFLKILTSNSVPTKLKISMVILVIIFSLFYDMFIPRKLDIINQVIQIRSIVNDPRILSGENVNTMINDILPNKSSLVVFIANTVINLLRIMFPVELINKLGVKYLVAFVYQLIISAELIKKLIYSLKQQSKIPDSLILIFAILLTQAVFEPDFGSYLKHQSAYVLLYYVILYK